MQVKKLCVMTRGIETIDALAKGLPASGQGNIDASVDDACSKLSFSKCYFHFEASITKFERNMKRSRNISGHLQLTSVAPHPLGCKNMIIVTLCFDFLHSDN